MTAAPDLDRAREILSASPVAEWLGMTAEAVGDDLKFHLSFNERHIGNPVIRAIHGGVVADFLQLAAECALSAILLRGSTIRTVNADIDYLSSTRAQDMTGAVQVLRHGRRISFVEATAWQLDENRPVATARFRIRVNAA